MSKRIQKILLNMREELLQGIDSHLQSARGSNDREVGDFYDDVDKEKIKQLYHLLGQRERQKLLSINAALQKIDDGSYGSCEECGEDIGKERIKALPFARCCIRCQSEIEKRSSISGEDDEESHLYKEVSLNEPVDEDD